MYDTQELDREILAAKSHTTKIHNVAYFNARIVELAEVFKPQCTNQAERDLLREKLTANVKSGQATGALQQISRVLSAN